MLKSCARRITRVPRFGFVYESSYARCVIFMTVFGSNLWSWREKMLKPSIQGMFRSRHLVVIPKSPPEKAPYKAPITVGCLSRQLRMFLRDSASCPPTAFKEAATNLVRACGPTEINRLVMVMDKHDIFCPELKRYIIARVDQLGGKVPLSTLLTVYSKFKTPSISDLIIKKISPDEVSVLPTSKLVSLLCVAPSEHLVVAESSKRLKNMSMYEIATCLNSLKKSGSSNGAVERFIEKAASCILYNISKGVEASPRDVSLILNAIGHFGPNACSPQFTKAFIDYIVPRFNQYSPVQTALTLHAIAKLDSFDFRLFDLFANTAKCIDYKDHHSKSVGMILYAMGKCEYKNDAILSGLSELVKRDIKGYDIRSIALCCYGFSKLQYLPKDLMQVVAEEIIYRSTVKRKSKTFKYTISDIGMISKAFANSASRYGANHTEIAYTLMELLKQVDASHDRPNDATAVVSVIEAFTNLDKSKVTGLDFWISKHLHPIIPQLSSVQLFSIIAALVKMNVHNKPLYTCMVSAIDPNIVDYKLVPKLLVKLGKIPSSSAIVNSDLVRNLTKVVSVNLVQYTNISDLAATIYGLSELNYRDEKLNVRLIAGLKTKFLDQNDWVDDENLLPMLAVAISRLRITDPEVHEMLYGQIFKQISSINSERGMTNILFSIATAVGSGDMEYGNWMIHPIVTELLNRLAGHTSNYPSEGIRQIQIVGLWLRKMRSHVLPSRTVEWLNRVASINTYSVSSIEQSSVAHREISKYLLQLGLDHTNEVVLGPFSLDMFVADHGVAIEVDGPHHFFRDSITRTSSSVLKHKLLEVMGYKVVHVPFQEWIQCTTDTRKLAYCNSIATLVRTSQ